MSVNLAIRKPSAEFSKFYDQLTDMTTEQLESLLGKLIQRTAEAVLQMAAVWMELERRGRDMSALKAGIGQFLPAVAEGRLLPEAVVRFAGNSRTLSALMTMSHEAQRRTMALGYIEVVRTSTSPPEKVPLRRVTREDITRAVDPIRGDIIEPAKQRAPAVRSKPSNALSREITARFTEAEYAEFQAEAARCRKSSSDLLRQLAMRAIGR